MAYLFLSMRVYLHPSPEVWDYSCLGWFPQSTHNLLEFRDTLPAEERSHLKVRILHAYKALLAEA
jgi:hypothetical protein